MRVKIILFQDYIDGTSVVAVRREDVPALLYSERLYIHTGVQ